MPSILTSLVLTAKDGASSIIQKIEGTIASLGKTSASSSNAIGHTGDALKSLTGAFSGAILQTSLLTSGFGLITNAAQQGLNAIEGQFGKARELQQTFVGNAASLAAQTGRSFDESMGVISSISTEITSQAAALPGLTQNYKDLGNTLQGILIRGYVDKKGNVDFAGFGKSVEGLSLNYEALSAGKGLNAGSTQLFLQKALSGGSLAELSQLEFGIRSPEVIQALRDQLKKQGLTELSQVRGLSNKSNILVNSAAPFVSDDFKARSANTVEGISRGFETKLFDQRIGVFGLLRSVDDEGTGVKNAIEAYTKFLSVTIGEKGLFSKLGELAKTLGIFIDPMQVLHDGFLLFTEAVLIVDDALDKATTVIKGGGGIGKVFQTFFGTIQEDVMKDLGIAKPQQQLDFSGIGNILGSIDYAKLGKTAGGIFTGLISGVSDFIQGIDWGGVLQTAGGMLGGAIQFVSEFFNTAITKATDISVGLENKAIAGLNNLMGSFGGDFDRNVFIIGAEIGTAIGRLMGAIVNFAVKIDWGGVIVAIGHLGLATIEIMTGIVVGGLYGIYDESSKSLSKVFSNIGDGLKSAWNTVVIGISNGISSITTWLSSFVNDTIENGKNQIKSVLISPVQGAGASIQSNVGGFFSGIGNALGFGSKFGGHIPHAAGGLLGAAFSESKGMPLGANLVMANDKEFILAPARRPISSAVAGGGGGAVQVNHAGHTFNININGAMGDLMSIADEVVNQIQARIDGELGANLG